MFGALSSWAISKESCRKVFCFGLVFGFFWCFYSRGLHLSESDVFAQVVWLKSDAVAAVNAVCTCVLFYPCLSYSLPDLVGLSRGTYQFSRWLPSFSGIPNFISTWPNSSFQAELSNDIRGRQDKGHYVDNSKDRWPVLWESQIQEEVHLLEYKVEGFICFWYLLSTHG